MNSFPQSVPPPCSASRDWLKPHRPPLPVNMAEVSLRLLRSKARHRLIEERIVCGGKHGCLLVLPCVEPIGTEGSYRLRLYTLWPSGAPGSRTVKPRQGERAYSQWAGSRASYHQNGYRRNGAQDVGSPLYKNRTAYYDILEVTGSATQAQIKTAYYKQSFRYHPDRNSGSEDAARRFGHVTEAYHVLGSVSLRKKYDRGVLSLEDVRHAKKPSGKSGSPSQKEAGGQRGASSSSTTPARPMFDFDAFYQAHYGEQLAREQLWKARKEHIEKKKQEKRMDGQFNKLGEVSALLLVMTAATLLLLLR